MPDARPTGPRSSKLAIVGIAPAREEIATGRYFTGPAGQILDKALKLNNLTREQVYVTNVHDGFLAPGLPLSSLPHDVLQRSINRLKAELISIKPNVVMPIGDEPFEILCGLNGVTKWRGSILESTLIPGQKCVPSIHTAWILRGMWKWFPVFTHIDLKRAIEESQSPELTLPIRNAITGPGRSTTLDYIEECYKHDMLSIDIEVLWHTKLKTGEIACLGLAFTPDQALCIPFCHADGSPYWGLSDEAVIWRSLAKLLQDKKIKKIGQNLAFEWIYFWLHRIYPSNMYIDLMLLHHTLYPDWGKAEDPWGRRKSWDEPGHSLALINSQYTRSPYYKDDGRLWSPRMGEHQFWKYNCMDVMCPMEIAPIMQQEAIDDNLWDFYVEYKQRPFSHYCRMEWFGVAQDMDKRADASKELQGQADDLQDRINQKLGFALNVNSPKQMLDLLYNKLGLKKRTNKKTKKPTADKHVLREYAEKTQNEVLLWIQELRGVLDLKGDVVDQPLGEDNAMHSHYGYTDTHRRTSGKSILGTGTNLQNIPVKGVARQLFIP